MSLLRFRDKDGDSEPSNSDDEYNNNERALLDKFRNRKRKESESETEVFGVVSENDSDDSDDKNNSDIALSDVEGQELDDNLPDVRAWGKEKKKYYGADYVDPDYGGYQEKDAHAAEIEEEEAKNLQNQLVQQLDDNDFSLDLIFKKKDKEEVNDDQEELIKTDLSKLTNKQKLQIMQKESPELFGLIEDFKSKLTVAKDYLHPISERFKNGAIENCKAVKFVQTYYQLILNYATNIYMYLLLKANKELKNHPVIQRLYQYRQLISQMEPVFEEIIKPQIDLLLLDDTSKQDIGKKQSPKPKKKMLKLLTQLQKDQQAKKTKTFDHNIQPSKKIKLDNDIQKSKKDITQPDDSSDEDVNNDEMQQDEIDPNQEMEDNVNDSEGISKRAITYQIAKNKGLTPHRKKELRNPRVKHKIKFRKALIRRKGAVREPRKELQRYSGEISGIKTSVSKSIKFKS